MPDYTVGDTVFKRFTTRQFSDGVPTILSGTPVVSAYEDDSITQITAGITLGVDHDGVAGLNLLTIVATGANGYEAGKSYDLVITTGTVGGVTVIGEVVWHFTLSAEAAAVDLANGTDGLGAIKAETALIVADTNELQTDDVPGLIAALNDITAASVWAVDATGQQTQGTFGQAIGDPGADADTIYGSVVTGAAGANIAVDIIAVKAETALIVADTNELQTDDVPGLIAALNDPTAATIADAVHDEALADHQTQGTSGAATTMTAYLGPLGPGVYLDDGAANTGTTLGDDGTVENPVSTIAAATTIASNLGVQTFYLINDTVLTLAQIYEGFTFVGLGLSNKITLGSQDVDNSEFHNLILTGTQGGTGQFHAIGCSLTALVSAELIAHSCWLTGNITLRAATTHIFKDCCSAVAGQATPDLTFPGSGTTEVSFRNYSGGLTVKSATTNDTMSFESDGQIIIDASCTSLTVSVRGNCQITDNGTTTSLTQEAAINLTNINAEVVDVLDTDTSVELTTVPAAASSIRARLGWLFALARNKGTQTSTTKTLRNDADGGDIATSAISDDGTTFTRGEWS